MPAALTNAFYFDAAIDALFVRTGARAGHALRHDRRSARHRRGVREAAFSAQLARPPVPQFPDRPRARVRADARLRRGVLRRRTTRSIGARPMTVTALVLAPILARLRRCTRLPKGADGFAARHRRRGRGAGVRRDAARARRARRERAVAGASVHRGVPSRATAPISYLGRAAARGCAPSARLLAAARPARAREFIAQMLISRAR